MWLKSKYQEAIRGMSEDIKHIEFKMNQEIEPRELDSLRKIKRQLVERMDAFQNALNGMDS